MRLIGAIILLLLGCTGCCVPKIFDDRGDNVNDPI